MSRVAIPPGNIEFKYKEQLYALFYELTSEIKGKDIELEEKSYINNINTITLSQLIDYLRDTIHILINQQCVSRPVEQDKPLEVTERLQFDQILQHHEANEKLLLKKYFELMTIKEILEIRLVEYMKIEKEFRDLKDKVKYEEGRFLKNERKDNEIIIIRAENTILKRTIAELEEKNEVKEKESKERDILIQQLSKSIQKQKTEIEQLQKEMKVFSNININVNNTNNNSSLIPQKCSFCGGRFNSYHLNNSKSPERTPSDRSQLDLFNIKKLSTQKLNRKIQYNTNLMNKSTPSKQMDLTSSKYHQNKSLNINMIMDMTQRDNLLNQNWNLNKNKISPYCMKISTYELNKSSMGGSNSLSSKRNLSSRISLSKKSNGKGSIYSNQLNNKSYLASSNCAGKT